MATYVAFFIFKMLRLLGMNKGFFTIKKLFQLLFICSIIGFLLYIGFCVFFTPQIEISYIENRYLTTNYSLKESNFINGTFQEQFENLLSDQFPKRRQLVNLKRKLDYKTSFLYSWNKGDSESKLIKVNGSIYQVGTSNYLISYPIVEEDEERDAKIITRVEEINALQENNPEIQVYIYRPLQAHEFDIFDEANNITSLGKKLNNLILEKSKVPIAFLEVEDLETYKSYYYASDHHYNNVGSYHAYQDILDLMNIDEEPLEIKDTVCIDEMFYGTRGQSTGFVLEGDQFCVYTFDYPEFEITDLEGNEIEDSINPNAFVQKEYYEVRGYFYNEAYSSYPPFSVFTVNENQGKGKVLIVGDSYLGPVAELLASHFYQTYFLQPVDSDYDHLNYDEFIAEYDIDKVLIMYTIENYFWEEEGNKRYEAFAIRPYYKEEEEDAVQ